MTSFIGNLTHQHDIPILHAHVTASTRDFQLVGGHFISGRINMTGEFAVFLDQVPIQRRVPHGRSIPLIEGLDRR
jgi:predicted DNA-binding protein with PD1-like motif